MDLFAHLPSLQSPLTTPLSQRVYSHITISGSGPVHLGDHYAQAGDHYAQAGDQPRQAEEKPFTVPFSRDDKFVPRGRVVRDLLGMIKPDSHSRAALFGMGGVGKTQIAIEFAYAYRDAFPDVAVFWLFVGNSERLVDSFARIAADLKLPGGGEPDTDICALVLNHMSDYRNGRWLLVVDNIDELDLQVTTKGGSGLSLAARLPQTSGSAILATTRDERIARDIAGSWTAPIGVDAMSSEDAALLFETKLSNPVLLTPEYPKVIAELGLLPLAIVQATAYMTHYKVDATQYLEHLRRNTHAVLSGGDGALTHFDVRRDSSQSHAVYSTIAITIERLDEECPVAVFLFLIMAVFDGQSIPAYLLESAVNHAVTEQEFIESLGTLRSLSLIKANAIATAYSIHKLAQGAAQTWAAQSCHHFVPEMAANLLLKVWPEDEGLEAWRRERELYSHVCTILTKFGCSHLESATKARLLQQKAVCLLLFRRYCDARDAFRSAYDCFATSGADMSKGQLDAAFGLSVALSALNRNDNEAEELIEHLIEDKKEQVAANADEYLYFVCAFASLIAHRSLRKNLRAESYLNSFIEAHSASSGHEEREDVPARVYTHLGFVLFERWRQWSSWGLGMDTDQMRTDTLHNSKALAVKAIAGFEKRTSTEIGLCIGITVPLELLGCVLIAEGHYGKAENALRHALCVFVKDPCLGDEQPDPVKLLQDINALRQERSDAEETMANFTEQHERCTRGLHGCLFYGAELD